MSRMNLETLLEDVARLDEGPGPAQNIDEARAGALVLGAMRRSGIVTAERCASSAGRRGKLVGLRRSFLLGTGVVVITTAAAAWVGGVGSESLTAWFGSAPADQYVSAGGHASAAAHAHANTPAQAAVGSASMAPVVAAPAIEIEPPGPNARSVPTRVVSAPRHGASAREAQHSAVEVSAVPRAGAAPERGPAVDLLARANQYRRERQYGRALELYLDVAQRYPDTRQAEAARIAAADLSLRHLSDPKGAAEQYRVAASGTGQLGEEAAYGLVEAQRAAGRYDLERTELERFLARFPHSPLAGTAQSRLDQLSRHGW